MKSPARMASRAASTSCMAASLPFVALLPLPLATIAVLVAVPRPPERPEPFVPFAPFRADRPVPLAGRRRRAVFVVPAAFVAAAVVLAAGGFAVVAVAFLGSDARGHAKPPLRRAL